MLALSILQDRGIEVKRHALLSPNRTLSSGRVREDIGRYLCAKPGCLFACRSPLVRQTRFPKIGCGARLKNDGSLRRLRSNGLATWRNRPNLVERTNQRL